MTDWTDTLQTEYIYKIVDFDRIDEIRRAFNNPFMWRINKLVKEGAIVKIEKSNKT